MEDLERSYIVKIAKMFYFEDKSKSDIASLLNISRFKVARILNEAISSGIVKITINEADQKDSDLAKALCDKFKLKKALVLNHELSSSPRVDEEIGKLAANYLTEILKEKNVVGFAWGNAVRLLVEALEQTPPIDVVQIAGAITNEEYRQYSIDLISKVAALNKNSKAHSIYLPMWVEDPNIARKLRLEPSVRGTCEYFDKIDILLSGIGNWENGQSGIYRTFRRDWRNDMLSKGAIADLCTTLINEQGEVVSNPIERQGFSISSEQIRHVPDVIGMACSLKKYNAVKAVLKGNWLSTLIVDAKLAQALLES